MHLTIKEKLYSRQELIKAQILLNKNTISDDIIEPEKQIDNLLKNVKRR